MSPTAGPTASPYNISFFFLATDIGDQVKTQSFIGIAVAIAGNVLISLALNCQKLAHKRLELAKQAGLDISTVYQRDNAEESHGVRLADAEEFDESRPLIRDRLDSYDSYTTPCKTRSRPNLFVPRVSESPRHLSGLVNGTNVSEPHAETESAVSIEIQGEEEYHFAQANHASDKMIGEGESEIEQNETDYLRSKLWWFGFVLMNVGEFGNFLSYAYAPASVVAPLGTIALIANCFFAPLMLKERLHKRDILGVVLAIFGAVTIVGAGKSSDVRLDPAGLIRAISRQSFVIYATICAVLIVGFGILSAGPAGRKWVFVDVSLCALFGGFTVLATKAVSTLLSLHWIEIFKDWITYPIVAVLAITGIGQIKYLNRALMKFDSKVVIPTFFVSFNLSAIIGSAILYGDFENVQVHQLTTFFYGCATIFLGVFFLTRSTGEATATPEEAVVRPANTEEDRDSRQTSGRGPRTTHRPPSQSYGTPALNAKRSSASLVLSAGQYLLLAASPPRERGGSPIDRAAPFRSNSNNIGSPASLGRRTR